LSAHLFFTALAQLKMLVLNLANTSDEAREQGFFFFFYYEISFNTLTWRGASLLYIYIRLAVQGCLEHTRCACFRGRESLKACVRERESLKREL
jgi:hypothetical protein